MEILSDGKLSIREMKDSDDEYLRMLQWLSGTSVKKWYDRGGLTFDAIRKKYRPRVLGKNHVRPVIIEWSQAPIGYIQYYETAKETEYNQQEPLLDEPNVWAMDIFIGEKDLQGKGIGSSALSLMLKFLFQTKGARKVIIDPDVRNARAIRAYEKAGFKKVKVLKRWEKQDDEWTDAWLMICEKP